MSAGEQLLAVGKVFVPGGLPTVTYNARGGLGLESRLGDYLDEGHRILSISGPTKSGKTVLLKSSVGNGLWLSGGAIGDVEDFWMGVVDELDLVMEFSQEDETSDTTGRTTSAGAAAKPLGIGPSVTRESTESTVAKRAYGSRRSLTPREAARRALLSLQHTLIVDDFHYIDADTQLQIVRALKPLVFEGVRVVFAAVPHRAYDAVRVEKEMTGRLEQIQIPVWQPPELERIASDGFAALNVTDPENVASVLSRESYGSPHLMQSHCLELCKSQGIRSTGVDPRAVSAPSDLRVFFRNTSRGASKAAYDLLAKGPRQRTDRKRRVRSDGVVTDIYGATLAAIGATGPKTKITYDELRAALRRSLSDDEALPERHEITRVLDEMCKIARTRIAGEPVIDFDSELSILYLADPFFAFFLKWGFIEHPVAPR